MTPRLGSAVLALAIGLGSPAWAAKVYVPYAVNQEDRGAFQRTELLLSNGQPSLTQQVSYRLLTEGAVSGARSLELDGGKSLRIDAPVAVGARGLLEVDAPAGVSVSARLVVTRPGADPVSTAVPVLDARSAFVASAEAKLQGLARIDGVRKTALGLVNLGTASATCQISVADGAGNRSLRGSVQFALKAQAQDYREDLFELFGAEVPESAVATVSCSQKFWSYAVITDDATGATEFVTPAFESVAEGLTSSTQASIIFALPGTFLTSSKYNHNWQYNMKFPTDLSFHIVKLDFDVYVGNWDPKKPSGTHCLFWLEKGTSWATMFGYANALGTKNQNKIRIINGGEAAALTSPGVKPGNTYHIKYAYDLITKKVWWEVRTAGGSLVTYKSFPRTGNTFTAKSFFIQFGTQISRDGPEAKTYGWKFSNFRAEYIP